MNIASRAKLLKKLIEICDTEIFSKKQVAVYVINKAFVSNTYTASYNNTDYLKMFLFSPIFICQFAIAKIRLFGKRTLHNRKKVLIQLHYLKSIKIACEFESYFVIKQKDLLSMDLVKLASIACHEVRHRVQHYHDKGHYGNTENNSRNSELLEFYKAGRLKARKSLNIKKVKESHLEYENDAYFIQSILIKNLNERFPDGSFSIDEFRVFVRENKDLLNWKNPYLK